MRRDTAVESKAVIKGNEVVRIEIAGRTFPLLKKIPIEEFPKISQAIEFLSKYIDFAGVETSKPKEEWTDREIATFLSSCNERQVAVLEVLLEGEISRRELVQEISARLKKSNLRGWDLGGALAGIANRTNQLNKIPLYESEWRRLEGNEWDCYYRLNPKYIQPIRQCVASKAKLAELLPQ
ncbi:MAG: hypothetical protein ACE5PO_08055 [Candidatus Bathyarchaeia archaeon]